jgi:hypothetical protein
MERTSLFLTPTFYAQPAGFLIYRRLPEATCRGECDPKSTIKVLRAGTLHRAVIAAPGRALFCGRMIRLKVISSRWSGSVGVQVI